MAKGERYRISHKIHKTLFSYSVLSLQIPLRAGNTGTKNLQYSYPMDKSTKIHMFICKTIVR